MEPHWPIQYGSNEKGTHTEHGCWAGTTGQAKLACGSIQQSFSASRTGYESIERTYGRIYYIFHGTLIQQYVRLQIAAIPAPT